VAISQEERAFFVALGARIAQLRKSANITQVQLAEELGVSQQTVNAYEMGHRRMAISVLPRLARLLGVSIEALRRARPLRQARTHPTAATEDRAPEPPAKVPAEDALTEARWHAQPGAVAEPPRG